MSLPVTINTLPRDNGKLPEGIYLWRIDKAESDRLSEMLDFEFSELGVVGTFVLGPRLRCHTCEKLSGFDDFVAGVIKNGVNNELFLIEALSRGLHNTTPPQKLDCCVCGTTFLERDSIVNIKVGAQLTWFDVARNFLFGMAAGSSSPSAQGSPPKLATTVTLSEEPATRQWYNICWLESDDVTPSIRAPMKDAGYLEGLEDAEPEMRPCSGPDWVVVTA